MVTLIGCVVVVLLITFALCGEFQIRSLIVALIIALMLGLLWSGVVRQIAIAENTSHYTTHSKPKKLISLNNQKKIDLKYEEKNLNLIQYKDGKDTVKVLADKYSTETKYGETSEVIIHYHMQKLKNPSPTWDLFYLNDIKPDTIRTGRSYTLYLP